MKKIRIILIPSLILTMLILINFTSCVKEEDLDDLDRPVATQDTVTFDATISIADLKAMYDGTTI